MQPVYHAEILEQTCENDTIIEDHGTLWTAQDPYEQACTSFAFEVPRQIVVKGLSRTQISGRYHLIALP